jgi:micrococcal nuclease
VAVAIVLLALVCQRIGRDVPLDAEQAGRFHVVKVTDGDSMILTGGERLRLANIDAPEENEPLYDSATAHLTSLADDRDLRLRFPAQRRDKYGRLLAWAFVDSLFVGEEMLRHGLAYLLLFDQSEYHNPLIKRLLAAQREAVTEEAGLHGLAREAESHYVATSTGLRFHRPGCRTIRHLPVKQSRIFDNRQKPLREGLAPCRICRP